jgi:hypothetical protein
MAWKLRAIEVDVAQVAYAVPQRLIIKVARGRMTAFTTRCHSLGANLHSKLDHRNKAVSTCAVVLLGTRERARSE